MGGDRRAGVLGLELEQLGLRKRLVHDADAGPEQHLPVELARQIAAEMAVRPEDDLLVLGDLLEDRLGARRGDDHVRQGLNLGRAVDVGQRDMVGVRLAEGLELFRRARILEAAAGVEIGQDHDLLRRKDLGGVGHELDPAEGDHFRIGGGGLAAQLQRVPHEIGEVLQFGLLVVMREDHSVALLAQPVDLGAQVEPGEAPRPVEALVGHVEVFPDCCYRGRYRAIVVKPKPERRCVAFDPVPPL